METELSRAVKDTIAFERMAAIELRRIAQRDADIADHLRAIADELEEDADQLGQHLLKS